MLELLKKIENNGQLLYVFNKDNKVIKLTKADAYKLVQSCPAGQRNCKLVNGHISMKAGYGELETERQISSNDDKKKRIGGVRIYTKHSYFNKCYIKSNDTWFINVMYVREFLRQNLDIIKKIDNAEIIDWNLMTIKTPYGITNMTSLSTGLKTLLNIRYVLQKEPGKSCIISANECGDNILPYIFKDVNNTVISLYIVHPILSMPTGYDIYLNNELLEDVFSFSEHIE